MEKEEEDDVEEEEQQEQDEEDNRRFMTRAQSSVHWPVVFRVGRHAALQRSSGVRGYPKNGVMAMATCSFSPRKCNKPGIGVVNVPELN